MRPFLFPPPLGQPHSVFAGTSVHAGYFRFSINHRTLIWTTGPLTCVYYGLSYACVYTGGWEHRQRVSATLLTRGKNSFSCAPDGIRTVDLWRISGSTL